MQKNARYIVAGETLLARRHQLHLYASDVVRILGGMKRSDDFAKTIAAYHSDRCKSLRVHCSGISKNTDTGAIHKTRISAKKITALFHLMQFCHPLFDSNEELKQVRALFKNMGKLRDQANMLLLCDRFKIDKAIMDSKDASSKKMLKKIRRSSQKLQHHLPTIRRAGKKNLKHLSYDKWRLYIQEKNRDIKAAIATGLSADNIHPLRKEIKDLVYNAALYETKGIVTIAALRKMDQLQDLIGSWHDLVILRSQPQVIRYGLSHRKEFTAIGKEEKRLLKDIIVLGKKTV